MDAKYDLLNRINAPSDLSDLSPQELDALAGEIRAFLVENVSKTGGHLASNLGVVELTLALHRVMKTPHDRIVFDVGHQSYVHKILTGRRDRFDTLRQGGGLSAFTNPNESEHDAFIAGHSSTSLSAALGFARADKLKGSDAYTVAVVGDGAFTGGMIHEALNNCENDLRLIIIINENEMSISKNIGHFAENMAKLRSGRRYLKTKRATRNFIKKIPLIGNFLFRCIRDFKKMLKNAMYGSNYFEDLGLDYFGPVDGHDRASLEFILSEIKSSGRSALIHIKTVKGRGFEPAENDPGTYHGIAPADSDAGGSGFSNAMTEYLTSLAKTDETVCAVTAAMGEGTGLSAFGKAYPDRYFDVGIAEEHALTFSAGLAAGGMTPIVGIYSTFLQRGYDNIIHDIALQNLPVLICVDRAGLNSSDGATHHGIFDVAFLGQIPNMTIYTPVTYSGLKNSIYAAIAAKKPAAIRYPNGCEREDIIAAFYPDGDFSLKGARTDFSESDELDAVIITHGRVASEALKAEKILKEQGARVGVILLEMLKPYCDTAKLVDKLIPKCAKKIVFLEEEIKNGGMGMLLSYELEKIGAMRGRQKTIIATDDSFVIRETDEPIYKTADVDAEAVVKAVDSQTYSRE